MIRDKDYYCKLYSEFNAIKKLLNKELKPMEPNYGKIRHENFWTPKRKMKEASDNFTKKIIDKLSEFKSKVETCEALGFLNMLITDVEEQKKSCYRCNLSNTNNIRLGEGTVDSLISDIEFLSQGASPKYFTETQMETHLDTFVKFSGCKPKPRAFNIELIEEVKKMTNIHTALNTQEYPVFRPKASNINIKSLH